MVIAMTAGRFMLTMSWLTVNWLCLLDSGINGVDFVQFCTVGGGVQRVESFDIRVLQAGAESGLARVRILLIGKPNIGSPVSGLVASSAYSVFQIVNIEG